MMKRLSFLLAIVFCPVIIHGQTAFSLKRTFSESNHQVTSASFSQHGKYIITTGSDKNIIIWNPETGIIYRTLAGLNNFPVVAVFEENSDILASAGGNDTITLWHPSTSLIYSGLTDHKGKINALAFSHDGRYLASGGSDNKVYVHDLTDNKTLFILAGHEKEVTSVCFSPDGLMLASTGADKKLILWRMDQGKMIVSKEIHSGPVRCVKFSPDGNTLVTGSDDGSVKISDVSGLITLKTLSGHTAPVISVDYSSDGKYIISGGQDHRMILWEAQTGKILTQSEKMEQPVISVSFNPNGSDFVSAFLQSENFNNWTLSGTATSLLESLSANKSGVMADLFEKEDKEQASSKVFEGVEGIPDKKEISENDLALKKSANKNKKKVNKVIRLEELAVMGKSDSAEEKAPPAMSEIAPGGIKSVSKSENEIEYKSTKSVEFKEDVIEGNLARPSMAPPLSTPLNIPEIELYSPYAATGIASSDQNSTYVIGRVTNAEGTSVILVNKKPVKLSEAGVFEYKIDLAKGDNPVDIIAVNNKGKMKEMSFAINCTAEEAATTGIGSSSGGKFYALLIGINNYKSTDIPSLDNPINDAGKLNDVLLTRYAFDKENIVFLKNPTLNEIITTLDELVGKITQDDNLLIFYAGHGYWDEKGKVGYWFPSDATKNSTVNWFRNSTLRDFIGSIQAKHTLLIADACFSGAIFKTRDAMIDAPQGVQQLYDLPSRKAMTSGVLQVVPDESTFMKYLVEKLNSNNEKFLPSELLFSNLKTAVMNNSTNVPQYGVIQNVGDEGGDFIFMKR